MTFKLFNITSKEEIKQFILDNNFYLVEKLDTREDWEQLKLHLDLEFEVFVSTKGNFSHDHFSELRYNRSINSPIDNLSKRLIIPYRNCTNIEAIKPLNKKGRHELNEFIKLLINQGFYISDRIYINREDLCQYIENY